MLPPALLHPSLAPHLHVQRWPCSRIPPTMHRHPAKPIILPLPTKWRRGNITNRIPLRIRLLPIRFSRAVRREPCHTKTMGRSFLRIRQEALLRKRVRVLVHNHNLVGPVADRVPQGSLNQWLPASSRLRGTRYSISLPKPSKVLAQMRNWASLATILIRI